MQLPAPVLELRTTSAAWLVANGAVTEATGGGTPPTEVALGSTYPISLRVKAELQDVQSQNVVAVLQGTDTAAPALVVCGHYDHLGRVQGEGPDDAVYSGANDNASGVAFVLSLSDELARRAAAGQRLRNTVVFIAFSGEECGLHGSACYTEPTCALPPVPLGRTKLVLNFDLLGYGEEGAMVVGASTFTALADELWALNDGIGKPIALSRRPNAANSDHWPFTERGIPGLFFYLMGGKTHYHDVHDRPEELSLAGFWALRRLMLLFVAQQS
jgi:Zn-dependent M28 family amino/carboxypeptidase